MTHALLPEPAQDILRAAAEEAGRIGPGWRELEALRKTMDGRSAAERDRVLSAAIQLVRRACPERFR